MNTRLTLSTIVLLSFSVAQSPGQPVVLSHPIEFQSPTTLIDFEAFPNGESLPPYGVAGLSNQWVSLGVLIGDSTPADGAARWRSTGPEIPVHSGTNGIADGPSTLGGFLDYTFVDSLSLVPAYVTEAGLWVQNGYSFPIGAGSFVTFYDRNNNPIFSFPETTSFDHFIGLRFTDGIARIRISDPDYFLTDDLQFGPVTPIPEPSTGALLAVGALICTMWRRCARMRCRTRAAAAAT